jgi:hypothetical protein
MEAFPSLTREAWGDRPMPIKKAVQTVGRPVGPTLKNQEFL